MPIARYKDLCLDAVDPLATGRFWAAALGLTVGLVDDGLVRLDGPGPRDCVWVNQVPEPHVVKNRLHIDVNTTDVAELVAAGGTLVDAETFPWTVLVDPDGGELCAFVRPEPPRRRLYELVLDCADPGAQARWWHHVLGGSVGHDEEHGWWWVDGIDGAPFESIVFVAVPEPKTVKNRVHFDVLGHVGELLAHGASEIGHGDSWTVLADPEGNEFCAFPPGV